MGQSPRDDEKLHGRGSEPDGFDIPPEATVGLIIGNRFLVQRLLGSGAMARVYLAKDSLAKNTEAKDVAVKVLHRKKVNDPEVVARFRREIDILAGLGHPSFVRMIAFEENLSERPWFAMEYVNGETLQERIARGPMPLWEMLPILDGVARGLVAAHEAGVVHRDLKPENILLTNDPKSPVRVVDFGLSRFAKAEKLTGQGTILGTPRFMAPELLVSGATADARADIFSLGAIFFEAVTGKSVYPAEDLAQLAGCILMGRTRKLSDLDPALTAYDDAVRKALARDPRDRYSQALEFSEDVRHIADLSGRFPAYSEIPEEPTRFDPTLARKILASSGQIAPKASQGISIANDLQPAKPRPAPLRISPPSAEFSRPAEPEPAKPPAPAQTSSPWWRYGFVFLAAALVLATLWLLKTHAR